jgi:hypothetical protein
LVIVLFIATFFFIFLIYFIFNFILYCFISYSSCVRFSYYYFNCFLLFYFFYFGGLKILLRDFFRSALYRVTWYYDSIHDFWRLTQFDFFKKKDLISSFNFILLGLQLFEFFHFPFYRVVLISYPLLRVGRVNSNWLGFFF